MGQEQSGNVMSHKGWRLGEFEVRHLFHYIDNVFSDPVGQCTHSCAEKRTVPDVSYFVRIYFRKQPYGHGHFDVDVAAESAGQYYSVKVRDFEAHRLEQGLAPAVDGSFCADEVPDIVFGNDDVPSNLSLSFPSQYVFINAVHFPEPV